MQTMWALGVFAVGVAACGGASPNTKPLYLDHDRYTCDNVDSVAVLVPVLHVRLPDGGVEERTSALADGGDYAVDNTDQVLENPRIRHRAALLCACRAGRQRHSSRSNGTWSDILVGTSVIGAGGGTILDGIGATGVDPHTQKTLLSLGITSVGVGALAGAAAIALNLNQRAAAEASGASDQEVAAAVLLNDHSGPDAWTRAWSACVLAEDSTADSRLSEPTLSAFADAGPDGG
jgi:hypothetical protein